MTGRHRALLVLRPAATGMGVATVLESLGLRFAGSQERGDEQFCEHHFSSETGDELCWREDHLLGQQLLLVAGPAAPSLGERLAAALPSYSFTDALALAGAATTSAERIRSLGPLMALVGETASDDSPDDTPELVAAYDQLAGRLHDPDVGVRRAALAIAGYFVHPAVTELLASVQSDPVLSCEVARQLRVRRPSPSQAAVEPANALPLGPELYQQRAIGSRASGRPLAALIELRTALALARRQGLRLQPLLAAVDELLSAPVHAASPADSDAAAALLAPLTELLANEQFYPAEELATALLGAAEPPSPLATLPSLLALRVPLLRGLAAAVDRRGRPDLAVAPLGRALLLVEAELANAPTATDLWLGRARLLADLADLARRS